MKTNFKISVHLQNHLTLPHWFSLSIFLLRYLTHSLHIRIPKEDLGSLNLIIIFLNLQIRYLRLVYVYILHKILRQYLFFISTELTFTTRTTLSILVSSTMCVRYEMK